MQCGHGSSRDSGLLMNDTVLVGMRDLDELLHDGVLVKRNRQRSPLGRTDQWFDGISHIGTSMRGADVDCSRISVRAVRSHNPSHKATVDSVASSHLAPCLTRWRREGWHRLGHAVYHLGIFPSIPLGDHLL